MAKFKNSNRGRRSSRANLTSIARRYSNQDGSFTDYGVGDASTSTDEKKPKKPRTMKDFIAERKKSK